MAWLRDNAPVIEALAAVATALVAVAALVGVALQIRAADRLQQAQGARDIYRESLTLAVQHPDLAAPLDTCALLASERGPAYVAYVDHLLYTAEQVTAMDPGWFGVFDDLLSTHDAYLCSLEADPDSYTDLVANLLARQRLTRCATVVPCAD